MKKQILYSGTFENLDLHSEEVTDTLIIARAARFFAYSERKQATSSVCQSWPSACFRARMGR